MRNRYLAATSLVILATAVQLATTSTLLSQSDGGPEPSAEIESLVKQLAADDLQTRREAIRALSQREPPPDSVVMPLAAAIADADPQVANGALQLLASMGQAAESASPQIFALFDVRDAQRRYRAAHALGKIASNQSAELTQGFASKSARVRTTTAAAVGWMADPGPTLIDRLVQQLLDADPEVAGATQAALARLGPQAVPALEKRIAGDDPRWQAAAADVIGQMERAPGSAVVALLPLCQHPDASVRSAAFRGLARHGQGNRQVTAAVLSGLSDEAPEAARSAISALIRLQIRSPQAVAPLIDRLDDQPPLASLAAAALPRMGDHVLPAVPELLQRLSPATEPTILSALRSLGTTTLPYIVQTLADGQLKPEVAAGVLAGLGPAATAELAVCLDHTAAPVRAAAADALGRLGTGDSLAARLIPLLDDKQPMVRAGAARGLAALGPAARAAIPKLCETMNDDDVAVRTACLTALTAIDANASDPVRGIVLESLQDHAAEVRREAAAALSRVETLPESSVETLAVSLSDSDPQVRVRAAEALGRAGSVARPAQPRLLAALADEEPAVVQAAVQSLGRIGQLDATAVEAIRLLLADPHLDVRVAALTTLGAAGPVAQAAAPEIKSLGKDNAPAIRLAALRTLTALAEDPDEQLGILVGALDDDDWVVRREIISDLSDRGPAAVAAVPRLLQLMQNGTDQEAALNALRKIDNAPAEAVPQLIEILRQQDSDRRTRFYALHLLRKTGPAARDALPVLSQLRDESDGRRREFLDRAIRDIEASASR